MGTRTNAFVRLIDIFSKTTLTEQFVVKLISATKNKPGDIVGQCL